MEVINKSEIVSQICNLLLDEQIEAAREIALLSLPYRSLQFQESQRAIGLEKNYRYP
jgi:hypothetical protein